MQRKMALFPGVIRKDFTKELIPELLSRKRVYYMQNHENTSKACSVKGALQ